MKLFIGLLFVISVIIFTFVSKGCGGYGDRLEASLKDNFEAKKEGLSEITRGEVSAEFDGYDTILTGTVEEGARGDVHKLFAEKADAGRGRVTGLEEGSLGPVVSAVEVVNAGNGKIDEAAVLGALGVAAGAEFVAGDLPSYAAKLKELPGVTDASVTSEADGENFKVIASVTPEPPAITKVNVIPNGEGEVDEAAVAQALGVNVGDAYDPSGFADAGKRVAALPGVTSAEVAGAEVEGGYEVTATVVPVKPVPMIVNGFKVEPLPGSTLPDGDLVGIAAVKKGDPFSAGVPGEIAGKLMALDTVKNADIKANKTPEGYDLVAVITPAEQKVVSSLEVIPVEGSVIDRDVAMKAAGVSKGDAFTPAMVEELEQKFAAIDGIASAEVTAEETVEGYKLIAKLTEAKEPAPKAITGITLNAPEGLAFDKAAAMKSLGVAVGQTYEPAQLDLVAGNLKKIAGVQDATVKAEETEGGYDLIAQLVAAKPEPKPVVAAAPPVLVDALKDINVYFATNSTEVSEEDFKKLVRAAGAIVKAGNKNPVAVTGFADPRGNIEYNQALSLRRANAVCDILVSNGVKRSLLTPDGAGVPGKESLDEQRRVEVRPSNK